MAFEDLLRAYEIARRRAQLAGRPISTEETTQALYPVMLDARKRALADANISLGREKLAESKSQFSQSLAQNQDIFNQQVALQNEARPWQYAGLGVSALGNLGMILYGMKQEQMQKNRLNRLMSMYQGGV